VQIQHEGKEGRRRDVARMKSASHARKAMASVSMLAEVMSSIQGRSADMVGGGTSCMSVGDDTELAVFKDMVCFCGLLVARVVAMPCVQRPVWAADVEV
jgi:hypothetical protein